jgi:putative methionine-R-sulfoxide reductase with GAF domain
VTDQKDKPVLNQQTFEKLLEAGYVLQEHSRKMQELEARMESHSQRLREQEAADQPTLPKNKPRSEEPSRVNTDYTLTLAEIVEVQRQIQARHLDLDKTLVVIAEKVARIANATGAAVGILEGKIVRYRAGAGAPALPLGSEVPLSMAVCAASVRTGQVIRSEDVNTEVLFDPDPCRQRGILSLLAVPIYHDGDIVGALELYFDRVHGYVEPDIHTCQLMAGLVTEAIGRDAESKLKRSMAAERSTMLAAIEKLRPNLVMLAQDQSAAPVEASGRLSDENAANSPCWKCGNKIVAEEQFCGKCGAPRDDHYDTSNLQSKVASAWHMQHAGQDNAVAALKNGSPHPRETTLQVAEVPQQVHQQKDSTVENYDYPGHLRVPLPIQELEESDQMSSGQSPSTSVDEVEMAKPVDSQSQAPEEEEDNVEATPLALIKPQGKDVVWSSAAKARDFLESVSGTRTPSAIARFWNSRRGDFYLAVAVILVVVVIRWGIWSNHPVGATSQGTSVPGATNRRKTSAPDADLSTLDKLLIGLGLAEAPTVPEYKGNPDTQVWIDLQTALYYCPGSDLYSKTMKGRLSSQRDAQLDQFQPANRRPCD